MKTRPEALFDLLCAYVHSDIARDVARKIDQIGWSALEGVRADQLESVKVLVHKSVGCPQEAFPAVVKLLKGYADEPKPDAINPAHYRSHPSGVECITIVEHMSFNLGNAVKYVWRAGLKSENPIEDLKKAAWYIAREIERLSK